MGNQIIKQPNGKYGVFSSIVDAFVFYDATHQEIIDYFVEKEVRRLTAEVTNIIAKLDRGEKPYHHFTMTWEEALDWQRQQHKDNPNLPVIS